jgi:hypothetical protein
MNYLHWLGAILRKFTPLQSPVNSEVSPSVTKEHSASFSLLLLMHIITLNKLTWDVEDEFLIEGRLITPFYKISVQNELFLPVLKELPGTE